jgi:hypothetical protein
MIITRLFPVALTLGVTLTTSPAFAGDFYNMACRDDQREWLLSMSITGDERVEFWRDDHPRVRSGSYVQNGDSVVARLEDMALHLHVAQGNASWVAGSAKGILNCRYTGDQRLARWQDEPVVTARIEPRPPAPSQPLELGPPPTVAPAPRSGDALCDFEHHCYSGAPVSPRSSPNSVDTSHVPITLDGEQALARIIVGSYFVQALVDTGASSMSLPEDLADKLIASGEATESDGVRVTHAGGEVLSRRSIVVASIHVGSHIVRDIQCVVEPSGSKPLLGYGVLRLIAPKFAIDTANSSLVFE